MLMIILAISPWTRSTLKNQDTENGTRCWFQGQTSLKSPPEEDQLEHVLQWSLLTLSDGILPAQNETCRWNKQLHNRTWLFSMARFCLINWFLTSCSKDCITMINYYGEPGQKLKRTDSRAEPEIARWLKTSQRATHMLNVFEELIDNWEQSTEAAGTGNKNSSKYGVTWYTSIR